MAIVNFKTHTHVVDIIGNVIGRDQPIMLMEKAIELSSCIDYKNLTNSDFVFFDPFCKAGEILLACALLSCWAKSKDKLFGINEVKKELYQSKRYFGLAPDERHYRLSLRTFLGNTYSHQQEYTHIIRDGHYLSEIDGKLDRHKFEKELDSMLEYINEASDKTKIVAIGNPPYQESDGGFGKSAANIYQYFVEALTCDQRISEFVLVIPARWFGGGKGLDTFRTTMLNTIHLQDLKYFKNASSVFPTVDINGGVCFLHYNKSYAGVTNFSDESHNISIKLNEFDIIPDDPLAFDLIRKIKSSWKGMYVGDIAWPSKPFGVRTYFFDKNNELSKVSKNAIPCLSKKRELKYISIENITKNRDKIDLWKVCVPKAAGGSKGKRRSTVPINQIFIVEPGVITTETYNVIQVFESKKQAENFSKYLKTDFARYLVGLRKITQDVPPDRWNWVPYIDVNEEWNDAKLYNHFKISTEEQLHIRKKIKEWS